MLEVIDILELYDILLKIINSLFHSFLLIISILYF